MDIRLAILKQDILRYYPTLSEDEWEVFQTHLTPVSYKKDAIVFPVYEVCTQILYVSEGILASEYHDNDKQVISRFFTKYGLCSNIVSLVKNIQSLDQVFSITEVQGVLIPKSIFLEYYLHMEGIGLYWRKKLIEVVLEDKQFIAIKTISGLRNQLTYFQEEYPEVILEAPWKHIANFLGVTPAWLSRTLKKKQIRKE